MGADDSDGGELRGWDRFSPLGSARTRRVGRWPVVVAGLAVASLFCLMVALTRDVPGFTGSCPFQRTPLDAQAITSRKEWWTASLALAALCPLVSFVGAFFNEPPGRYWKAALGLLVLPVAMLLSYVAIIPCPYN